MAWIQSHQELRGHPKVSRLARSLGVPKPQAIGHLHLLWWWALDYAPEGNLASFSDDEIADASEWKGDAAAFRKALIETKWIDPNGELHDYADYTGKLVQKRKDTADRVRAYRERQRVCNEPDVTRYSNTDCNTSNVPEQSIAEETREQKTSKQAASHDGTKSLVTAASPPVFVSVLLAEGWSHEEISRAKEAVVTRPNAPKRVTDWAKYLRPVLNDFRNVPTVPDENIYDKQSRVRSGSIEERIIATKAARKCEDEAREREIEEEANRAKARVQAGSSRPWDKAITGGAPFA